MDDDHVLGQEAVENVWPALVVAFLFLWLAVSFNDAPPQDRRGPEWRTEAVHW